MEDWFSNDDKKPKRGRGKNDIDINIDDSEFEKQSGRNIDELKIHIKKDSANEIRVFEKLKKEKFERVITELPKKNEYFHIVSNGTFDYFDLITRILQLSENKFILYASTWTMNYQNIEKLFEYFDFKRLSEITLITGEYLQSREPLVFETLKQGLIKRQQRLKAFKNHCKIILLSDNINYFCLESSANFTANPRCEQTVFSNSKIVYDFHKQWINDLFI